nr:sulfotransferase [Salinibacter ruber]
MAPFFVIGSGRCGTTLFRRLMQAQGNTYIPPENWALGRCIRQYHKYGWLMKWKDMVDLQVGTLSHRSHHWFEGPPRDLVHSLHALDDEERSLAALINAEYMYHAKLKGRAPQRWGDNSPGNVFHAEAISEVFPDARFVHLLRDGVDVVASWLKYPPLKEDLEGAAGKWEWSVRLARQFMEKHPEKVIEVRYEDLVHDPEKELQSICEFLDHAFDPEKIESKEPIDSMDDVTGREQHEKVTRSISTDSVGKGRRKLENLQKRKVDELIGEMLVEVGYDPVSI